MKKMAKKPEPPKLKPAPSSLKRIDQLRDNEDEIKKLPEEDYENKKLIPTLEAAYDLYKKILAKKKTANREIKRIENNRRKLQSEALNYDKYKKAQVQIEDQTEEERNKQQTLYKSIMCPLAQKCPKDKSKRWPLSNDKSCTPFGKECPYAHHTNEL